MNKTQFEKIANRLIKDKDQIGACRMVIFSDVTSYAAEKEYNRPANTVSRDVNRIRDFYNFCISVVANESYNGTQPQTA